jgi:hypothetical protein
MLLKVASAMNSVDPNRGQRDPTQLARDLINSGFSVSAVIDALAAEGVARDRARTIISDLQRASFSEQRAANREQRLGHARFYMILGSVLFIAGAIWFSKYGWKAMFREKGVKLIWGLLSAGFFMFLYGLHLRK